MEQFNLDTWLQDKSHKICTRDGRSVRILDYNIKGDKHICIAVDDEIQESITTVDEDGHCLRDKTGWHESNLDLFFADEEEELTEFEKAIYLYICTIVTSCDGKVYGDKELKPIVKGIAKELFDLARKEVLKDLPKWKKATEDKDFDRHVLLLEDDRVVIASCVYKDEYYIELDDLRTLPKE